MQKLLNITKNAIFIFPHLGVNFLKIKEHQILTRIKHYGPMHICIGLMHINVIDVER